jgi:hypothetical protein
MSKPGMSPIAKAMLAALDRNDFAEFMRLKDSTGLPKDEPMPLKSCDFHFAPEESQRRK